MYADSNSMRLNPLLLEQTHMWQSRVEIEHYSVTYFDRITTFEVLYRSTSVKGGAHTHYADLSGIDAASQLFE